VLRSKFGCLVAIDKKVVGVFVHFRAASIGFGFVFVVLGSFLSRKDKMGLKFKFNDENKYPLGNPTSRQDNKMKMKI
jgi:hypothetical protein